MSNLQDDLRLLWDVSEGGRYQGEGVFRDPKAVEQLLRHVTLYHRYKLPDEVQYHSQREEKREGGR